MELNHIQKEFGKKLAEAMKAKNLNPYKLHKLTGITQTHIKQTLDGEMNTCLDSMRKYSMACEVPVKFFFDWE